MPSCMECHCGPILSYMPILKHYMCICMLASKCANIVGINMMLAKKLLYIFPNYNFVYM